MSSFRFQALCRRSCRQKPKKSRKPLPSQRDSGPFPENASFSAVFCLICGYAPAAVTISGTTGTACAPGTSSAAPPAAAAADLSAHNEKDDHRKDQDDDNVCQMQHCVRPPDICLLRIVFIFRIKLFSSFVK